MRSGSRPAFRARRTRERAVAVCTGRVPPIPTIHHQLRRCLAEQNSSRSRAHGAARISRISAVIILRSYTDQHVVMTASPTDLVSINYGATINGTTTVNGPASLL